MPCVSTSGANETLCLTTNHRLTQSGPKPNITDADACLEACQASQTKLAEGVASRLARLRKHRNRTVKLHQLPLPLFRDILLWAVDVNEWTIKQVHDLAQVSTYWRDAVLSSSLFFPRINLFHPPEVNKIVLQRNKKATLAVRCKAGSYSQEDILTYIKMAAETSHRWRMLLWGGKYAEEIKQYLEAPCPNLLDLFLCQTSNPAVDKVHIRLGSGAPLRHIDCDGVSIPWDSNRLIQLKSLCILDISWNVPQFSDLHRIIASSPQIRRLALDKLYPETSDPPVEDVVDSIEDAPLPLPLLSTLVLRRIPKDWTRRLAASIVAKSCRTVIIEPSDVLLLHSQSFHDLVAPVITSSTVIKVSICNSAGKLRIQSNPEPALESEWVLWANDTPGLDLSFPLRNMSTEALVQIGRLVGLNSIQEAVGLQLKGNEHCDNPSPFSPSSFIHFPNTHSMEISQHQEEVLAMLRHLSMPITVPGARVMTWPCPRLRALTVKIYGTHKSSVIASAILAFIRARHTLESGHSSLRPRELPIRLQSVEVRKSTLDTLPAEEAFEGIELKYF